MIDETEYNEFFHDFLIESTELIQEFETRLLNLEEIVKQDNFTFNQLEDDLQGIFRDVHTIKGLAGMMEFHDLKIYTHEAEAILDQVRKKTIPITEKLISELMFDILDNCKKLIENIISPGKNPFEAQAEIAKLNQFLDAQETEPVKKENKKTEEKGDIEDFGEEIADKTPKFSSNTIRVDTIRLDDLLDTVGELVIGKNRMIEVTRAIIDQSAAVHRTKKGGCLDTETTLNLSETVDQITRLIVSLQERSMKLRMVPIGYTFRKFKRLVRDLAMQKDKEVVLELEGEETEVDRAIIESMDEPILHIIRNSLDHGFETPEERLELGKPAEGILNISAYQENNSIVIEISDDGRGIDPKKVYEKALSVGLITESDELSEKEILNLIFEPGFSTAEEVTDISGRGVGMDVVRKNVVKLNGMIDVESELGQGTKVILTLPLTLAIIRVLLVKVGDGSYSIPINNIVETLSIPVSEIHQVSGYEAIKMRDSSVLPIIRLSKVLEIPIDEKKEKFYVVVAGIGEKRVGYVVDDLINQQDIVIKPLGNYLKVINGIAGATILGNGQISLVLDLASLWQEVFGKRTKEI